jgi:hypothetical protein
MPYHNSLSIPDPPAYRGFSAVPTTLEFGCHLPLALNRSDVQAEVALWFKLERQAGPLTQGTIIRAATLPAGGTLRLQPTDEHARFVLETDSISVFRCEAVPAEARYWRSLLLSFKQLGGRRSEQNECTAEIMHIDGEAVSYPFLTTVLQSLVKRTETLSRMSETAGRVSRLEPGAVETAQAPRLLINPNRHRALTLFFYQADKYEVVRCGLRRIDRQVAAPTVSIEAEIRAELDRQLRQLGLLDTYGQLTATAQTQFGWQRTFVLPTPHILVKTCLADNSITESGVFGAIKIDPRHRPGQAA